MLTATKAAKFKQVRRTLLAIGTAGGALCFANPAMASCVIAPGGTGTVANPGPNSRVVCTGTTAGINVATSNTQVTVQVEAGSTLNGDPAISAILFDGSFNTLAVGAGVLSGPAVLKDTDIKFTGYGSSLFVLDGSEIDLSGNPLLEISMTGAASFMSIDAGGHVTVPRPITISGAGSLFALHSTATLSASSNFTGSAMINGGTGSQNFNIHGTVEMPGVNAVETIVDASDGDDRISLNAGTRFVVNSSATTAPAFLLSGGLGDDWLYLENTDPALTFDSTGIEQLFQSGGVSTLRGSHEFLEITVQQGQLFVLGEAALGAPGSLLNILTDTRLRFSGSGAQPLTQVLIGGGTFEYAAGSNEFASANFLTGYFQITGGSPVISHSAAFGSAQVDNFSNIILRDVSIGNVLSGSGNYIVDGTATTLSGTNSMTGVITVQSGRLLVTSVSNLGNGQVPDPAAIIIAAHGSFNLDLQSSGTLENALSGTGTLNKTSAGNLTVNRSNSAFSGQVNLLGGRISVSASNPLGTGSIFFGGASIMDFDNTADIVLVNAITSGSGGDAVFQKNGAGRVTLTGNNSGMTGAFFLNQGVLAVNSVTGFGTGGYASLGGGGTLEVANAADETLGLRVIAIVPSVGTFRKLGTGRLTIGNQFEVALLAVDAGRVRVNQTITAANVNVANGASLDGTGRIIGTLTNNGTVAPGNSIGTLTVQGNYVHNSGSVLEIEFDANGNIDLLAVTGTATLNGGTLRFVSLGGAEGSGGTLLTATGGVTGTFASVQTVGAQLPLAVIYQTNSAIMAPSVLTARPSTFNAQFLAAADNAFNFVDLLPGTADGGPSGKRLWIQGYGSDGNRSASGTTLGYSHEGYGLAGGIVLPLSDSWTLGAAVGWSHGKIGLDAGGGSGEQSAVLGSVHLGYSGAGFALEGGVVYGGVDQETLRNVSFNGFSASVDGGTQSAVYGGYLGAWVDLAKLGGWDLSARVRGGLIHQSQEGFTESGSSPLRLAVPDLSSDTLQVQGGLGVSRKIGPGQLRFEVGARLTDNLGERAIPVTFAASAAGVTLQGDTRSSVDGFAAAALDLPLSGSVRVTVGYAGQVGQNDRHEGRIGLSIGF